MNKTEIINLIQEHKIELRRRGALAMSLFGSFARGEEKITSDIDILIDVDQNIKFGLYELINMRDFLKEILGRDVDLTTRGSIQKIRPAIEAEEVKIF